MTIIEFIKEQKTHIIYGGILVGLCAVGYNLLSSKPTEIIKTVTQTKYVDRNIVKTQKQSVDRVIVRTDKDGAVTTTTEHVTNDKSSTDKSKIDTKFVSKESTSYLKRYSLDIQYPLTFNSLRPDGSFNPTKIIVTGGYRLFNSPIFVTLGTNVGLDGVLVGIRYEF